MTYSTGTSGPVCLVDHYYVSKIKVFTQFAVLNEELLSEKNLVDVDRLYN